MKGDFFSWRPKDVETLLLSMARHTRFVGFGKISLSALAALLLLLIVVLPIINAEKGDSIRIVFADAEKGETLAPTMLKPSYQGVDASNQPFTVTADSATQTPDDKVLMDNVKADILLDGDEWLALMSNKAEFDPNAKNLVLSGSVRIFYDKGMQFYTEEAFVDMVSHTASGKQPTEIQSELGLLKAQGFVMKSETKHAIFTGPVHLTIYPGERK